MITLEASLGAQPEHPWSYVAKLVRLRWLILDSEFKRAKPLRKLLTLALGLLAVAVFVGSYLLSAAFLRLLASPLMIESGVNPAAFMAAIPALVVSAAFLVILMTSFRLLLQALYLADDMDFLLTAPIPIRAVFLTKLLEAILPSFILVLLFGLPVLYSLGAAGGYHILYFPLVLVVLGFLSLAAAGVASLPVMAVVRIFPAKRVAEVLAFLGAVLLFVASQWSNLTGSEFGSLTSEQVSRISQVLTRLNSAGSPLAWGGRSLVDLGEGRWLSGIFFLVLTLAASGAVFWLALNAAQRLYTTGWASLQVETQRKKPRRPADRRAVSGAGAGIFQHLLPPQVRAILLKDSLELRRDLRNLSQVITALIMGIVFAVMLLRSGGEPAAGKGEAPSVFMDLLQSARAYGSMAISMLVGWSLISRLALISFSMEGKSYWIIKTAPVSAGKQLSAKFLVAYLPALVLSWLYLLGIALLQKAPTAAILYGLPSVALILAGLCGINLAFGVRGAKLDWTDPRRMEDGVAGCLGMIASVAYQLVAILLFFAPPLGLPLLGISERTGLLIGLLAGSVVTLLCTILPLLLVKDRVYRIGEE